MGRSDVQHGKEIVGRPLEEAAHEGPKQRVLEDEGTQVC